MDWKTLFDEEEREIDRVLEEINNDPKFKDIEPPPEVHDELIAKIHEYQEQNKIGMLSKEEMELIRLGKCYKKRRKVERYAILAAALVAMLAIGSVSIGENKNILTMLKQMLTGGEQTVSDSGSVEPVLLDEEQATYDKIVDTYDFEPVKLEYLPEYTVFQESVFYPDMQSVYLYYGTEDTANIIYTIRPNYRESSFATIVEDEKIQEYVMDVNSVKFVITEYKIVESKEKKWTVDFVYQDVQYSLRATELEQQEIEKIINSLSFFE